MSRGKRFPHKVECRHGVTVEVRPLRAKDTPELKEFYDSLEPSERSLLRTDTKAEYFVKRIQRQIKDDDVYRLVAWHDDKIISSMSLLRGRANWTNHTGEIRVVTASKYRRYGIVMHLLEEISPYAESLGIEKLYVYLTPEQKAAIRLAKTIGFHREATLKDFLKDNYGLYHNVRIYSMDLEAAHKAMDELLANMAGYSG